MASRPLSKQRAKFLFKSQYIQADSNTLKAKVFCYIPKNPGTEARISPVFNDPTEEVFDAFLNPSWGCSLYNNPPEADDDSEIGIATRLLLEEGEALPLSYTSYRFTMSTICVTIDEDQNMQDSWSSLEARVLEDIDNATNILMKVSRRYLAIRDLVPRDYIITYPIGDAFGEDTSLTYSFFISHSISSNNEVRASLFVILPTDDNEEIVNELLAPNLEVLGEYINSYWGVAVTDSDLIPDFLEDYRFRSYEFIITNRESPESMINSLKGEIRNKMNEVSEQITAIFSARQEMLKTMPTVGLTVVNADTDERLVA